MLTILRRFLAVVVLMFWQGGFTFYAAVVVPVGQRVLGSHLEQGFITREVTWYLNIAGAVAMAFLALELRASGCPRQLQLRLRWGIWACMATVLLALIVASNLGCSHRRQCAYDHGSCTLSQSSSNVLVD